MTFPRPDEALAALGTSPGLPDDVFDHDGLVTKRPLRACALAELRPGPGQVLWDVGTGAGSIAIEWCRAGGPSARAIGFERVRGRAERARANARRLCGAWQVRVLDGDVRFDLATFAEQRAPEESPHAVFVGGGCTEATVEVCLAALRPAGRFVAHAVTLDTEQVLLGGHRAHGGTLTRLAVETAEPLGSMLGWKPLRPVVQWSLTLP